MPLPFHGRATGVLLVSLLFSWAANAASLKNILIIAGAPVDKTPLNGARGGASVNRLGGFGSDIYYDRFANVFYGLTDHGPGGGTIRFATRVQKFTLDIDPVSGAASNFNLIATIPFTIPAGKAVNGIAGPGISISGKLTPRLRAAEKLISNRRNAEACKVFQDVSKQMKRSFRSALDPERAFGLSLCEPNSRLVG